MVLRCKIEKMRVGGFQDGVGECMEGQIGGKSGPGVFRTRQSGLESALGRILVGTKNLRPPPSGVPGGVFPALPLAR